jgi:hypothetical protein
MVAIREVQATADVEAVASLARDIWTRHYVPIIGRFVMDDHRMAKAIPARG